MYCKKEGVNGTRFCMTISSFSNGNRNRSRKIRGEAMYNEGKTMKAKFKTKFLVCLMISAVVCTEMQVYAQNVVEEGIVLFQDEQALSDNQNILLEDEDKIDDILGGETNNFANEYVKSFEEEQKDAPVKENAQEVANEMLSEEDTISEDSMHDQMTEESLVEEEQAELTEEESLAETEEVTLEVQEELSPLGTRIDTEPERDRYKIYAEMVDEAIDMSREIKGDIWMAGYEENSLIYTGSAIKQDVRIYDGDKELVIDKDYKITYKKNINAKEYSPTESLTGVPCMTVQMLSGYTGSRTFYFSILQADINETDTSDQEVALTYNGKIQNHIPVISFHGKKLVNGKDFQIDYFAEEEYRKGNATGKTTISYTVEGKGNFKNTIKKDGYDKVFQYFIVGSDYNFSKAAMNITNKNVKYYGESLDTEYIKEQLGITLKIGKKLYTLDADLFKVELKNFDDVGTGTIVVTPSESAKANNYVGSLQKTYKIVGGIDFKKSVQINEEVWQNSMPYQKSIADDEAGLTQNATKLLKSAQDIYAPGIDRPIVEVGTSLEEGRDYSVTYTSNHKAGTAKVTFKGLGKYNGSFSKTFKIVADDSFTVEPLSPVSYQKGGVSPELTVKDRDGNILKKNIDYTVKFTKNTKVGMAHYKVTGKGNFSSNAIREGDFEIAQSNIADSCRIWVEDKVYTNKPNKYQSTPVVYDVNNNKKLSAGTDYKLSYQLLEGETARDISANKIPNIGDTIRVKVEGNNNYTGYTFLDYKIYDSKKSIKKLFIKIDSQVYTGEKIELTISDEPGKGDIHVFLTKEDMNNNQNELNAKDYINIRPNSYKNNIKNGTASVILETMPNSGYGGSATYKFTIAKKSAQIVGVQKISCEENSLEMIVGDSAQLEYVMNPINVDNPKITITESNTSLTIGEPVLGENGKITVLLSAQQMGMNVVTLTVEDINRKKVSASCFVYVKDSASEEQVIENQPEGYKSILDYQTTYTNTIPSGTYEGELEWTEAFQKAIRDNSKKKISGVWVPEGTYYVRQIDFKMEYPDVKLVMHPDAKLVRLPITATENNNGRVHILWFGSAQNISVSGGQLVGERKLSSSHSGEDGHGIMLMESKNITISHVKISNCWGDGIYLGIWGAHASDKSYNNKNIVINDCHVENARRNGLAITNGEGILVKNSSFNKTNGTDPQFGVDIETNNEKNPANGVRFENCVMNGNKKASFGIITKAQTVYLKDCTMSGDFHNRACTDLTLDNCKIGGTLYLVDYNATLKNTTYGAKEEY